MIVASGYGGICWTDDHLQQGASADPDPGPSSGTRGWASSRELGAGAVPDATGEPLRPGDTMMWGLLHPCGIRPPCRLHREPTLCENRRACGANRSASDGPALTARFDLANPVTAFPLERHAEAMPAGAAGW
jgi:threonine dehydrogenase-like Zn-dependent dehydrogenase